MELIFSTFRDIFSVLGTIGTAISYVWFIVFPVAFYILFKVLWMDYVNDKYDEKFDYVLLEIIPPDNIEKSPQLMESLYSGIAGVLKTPNVFEEYLDGYFTDPFSLELVSNEGMVHMYIRTPKGFRNLVESHLYAQYPDVEITEAPDYIHEVPPVLPNKEWDLWGTDFELTDPDPMPIRTYRYFEEDVTGNMIDPLAGLIEVMGKLGPGQKIWFQNVIVPIQEKYAKEARQLVQQLAGRVKKKEGVLENFFADLGDIFGNIISAMFGTPTFRQKGEEGAEEQPLEFRLTPGEKKVMEALEGNIGKNMFEVKMRMIYLGKRDYFTKTNVSAFVGGIKQFNDLNLNGFKPNNKTKTYANFVFKESRLRYRQHKIFMRYIDRSTKGKNFIMSTEELATIFHLPDMAVQAPFIRRVEAKRGGAPSNLPV